jgi:methylmalonyl-CoA/ethylmalonyl-CoA epimerase
MVNKVEHIGIAVKSIEESNDLFAALLGTEPYKREVVESEGVVTSFFKTGDSKIELLESLKPESAIAKFIEKRGEGIHHIAFEVEDIYKSISQLKEKGFIFLSEEPKTGADNKLICFIHPKSANGVLVELCQEIKSAK